MQLRDYGKLIMLLSILVCATVLGVAHVIDADTVKYVMVAELGYITGNGVLAVKGQAPSPVIAPKSSSEE